LILNKKERELSSHRVLNSSNNSEKEGDTGEMVEKLVPISMTRTKRDLLKHLNLPPETSSLMVASSLFYLNITSSENTNFHIPASPHENRKRRAIPTNSPPK